MKCIAFGSLAMIGLAWAGLATPAWATPADSATSATTPVAAQASATSTSQFGGQITEQQARDAMLPPETAAVFTGSDVLKQRLRDGSYNESSSTTLAVVVMAAMTGDEEMLDLLVKAGQSLDVRDGQLGETALQKLVLLEQDQPLRVLLRHGADPNLVSGHSGTAPLHDAISLMRFAAVRVLLESGKADPDLPDQVYGNRPLHFVSVDGDTTCTALLLAAGADPNAPNRHGLPPLHLAASLGQVEIARMLIEAGADVKTVSGAGKTPIDVIQSRLDDIPQPMQEHRVDVYNRYQELIKLLNNPPEAKPRIQPAFKPKSEPTP